MNPPSTFDYVLYSTAQAEKGTSLLLLLFQALKLLLPGLQHLLNTRGERGIWEGTDTDKKNSLGREEFQGTEHNLEDLPHKKPKIVMKFIFGAEF